MKISKLEGKRGISLIVLVITIIVMIILAAAIILSLFDSGIIGKANKAKTDSDTANLKEYVNALKAEYELMSDAEKGNKTFVQFANSKLEEKGYERKLAENGALMNENATAAVKQGLQIGDAVDYNQFLMQKSDAYKSYTTDGSENTALNDSETDPQPQTVTINLDITWKYLGINGDGKIEIVADLSSVNEVANNTKTTLGGKGGYLNGVKALNTICENLYSVQGVGTARSMNIDDVIGLLEYTGAKGLYLDSDGNYVETVMPLTVEEIDSKLGTSLGTQTTTPDGKALSTYESDYYNIDKNNEDTNADKTSLACNVKNNYWLASTCVYANFNKNCANFYLRYVGGQGVGGRSLFFSGGTSYISTYAIRPIVSLDPSVQLVKDTSATNTWKIQ